MFDLLKNVFSRPQKAKKQFKLAVKSKDERGVAILEFAIIAPFIVLCAIMIIDLSFLLVDCMIVSQVAKEGVRALSSFPGIVNATTPVQRVEVPDSPAAPALPTFADWAAYESGLKTYCTDNSSTPECGLFRAQYRMNELLKIHNLVPSITKRIAEVQRFTGTGVDEPDSVMVTLRVRLDRGILLRGMSFNISERGPYLYQ
jgi:hypothetical protein